LRIKEQEKRLTLNEHDDDDDDVYILGAGVAWYVWQLLHRLDGLGFESW
jgi:hypothetical protein